MTTDNGMQGTHDQFNFPIEIRISPDPSTLISRGNEADTCIDLCIMLLPRHAQTSDQLHKFISRPVDGLALAMDGTASLDGVCAEGVDRLMSVSFWCLRSPHAPHAIDRLSEVSDNAT